MRSTVVSCAKPNECLDKSTNIRHNTRLSAAERERVNVRAERTRAVRFSLSRRVWVCALVPFSVSCVRCVLRESHSWFSLKRYVLGNTTCARCQSIHSFNRLFVCLQAFVLVYIFFFLFCSWSISGDIIDTVLIKYKIIYACTHCPHEYEIHLCRLQFFEFYLICFTNGYLSESIHHRMANKIQRKHITTEKRRKNNCER